MGRSQSTCSQGPLLPVSCPSLEQERWRSRAPCWLPWVSWGPPSPPPCLFSCLATRGFLALASASSISLELWLARLTSRAGELLLWASLCVELEWEPLCCLLSWSGPYSEGLAWSSSGARHPLPWLDRLWRGH